MYRGSRTAMLATDRNEYKSALLTPFDREEKHEGDICR